MQVVHQTGLLHLDRPDFALKSGCGPSATSLVLMRCWLCLPLPPQVFHVDYVVHIHPDRLGKGFTRVFIVRIIANRRILIVEIELRSNRVLRVH